jgi:hypothetical protein
MRGQPENGVVRHDRLNCASSHRFAVQPYFDVLPQGALPVWLQVKVQLQGPILFADQNFGGSSDLLDSY